MCRALREVNKKNGLKVKENKKKNVNTFLLFAALKKPHIFHDLKKKKV